MSKTPVIPCPECAGRGVVQIPEEMAETLMIIAENPGCSSKQIHWESPGHVGVTAIHNRLVYLLSIGLVARKKESYCWKWTAVKGKK